MAATASAREGYIGTVGPRDALLLPPGWFAYEVVTVKDDCIGLKYGYVNKTSADQLLELNTMLLKAGKENALTQSAIAFLVLL